MTDKIHLRWSHGYFIQHLYYPQNIHFFYHNIWDIRYKQQMNIRALASGVIFCKGTLKVMDVAKQEICTFKHFE